MVNFWLKLMGFELFVIFLMLINHYIETNN